VEGLQQGERMLHKLMLTVMNPSITELLAMSAGILNIDAKSQYNLNCPDVVVK